MCGNVQLGSVVLVVFLFMFCPNHRQLRILDWNAECVVVFHVRWQFEEPRHGNIQITGQFKIWILRRQNFLLVSLPGAQKLGFQMWMCFLERLFYVVSEDAVQFCVIMNDCQFCCACVFFVCLYLHSEFLEKSLAYLMLSVCLYTTLHTMTLGGETLITKSV